MGALREERAIRGSLSGFPGLSIKLLRREEPKYQRPKADPGSEIEYASRDIGRKLGTDQDSDET